MINQIKLVNFMQHKDRLLKFSEGLNVIIGPNGYGKSTVLDGIAFSLFGDVPRKITKKDLINNSCNNCVSYTDMITDLFHVKRGLSKADTILETNDNHTFENPSDVTAAVEQILNIDKYRFFKLFYISQGHLLDMVEMTAAERKKIFDKIFFTGIDFESWYGIFNTITKQYKNDFGEINKLNKEIEDIIVKNNSLKKGILTIKRNIDELVNEIREKKEELSHLRDVLSKMDEVMSIKNKIENYSELIADIEDNLPDEAEIEKWTSELKELTEKSINMVNSEEINSEIKILEYLNDNWESWQEFSYTKYTKELSKQDYDSDTMDKIMKSRKDLFELDEKDEFMEQIKLHELRVLKIGYNEYMLKDTTYIDKFKYFYSNYDKINKTLKKYDIFNRIDIEGVIVNLKKILRKSKQIMTSLSRISELKLKILEVEKNIEKRNQYISQKNALSDRLLRIKNVKGGRDEIHERISVMESTLETLYNKKSTLIEEGNNLKYEYKNNTSLIELKKEKVNELKRLQLRYETFSSFKKLFHKDQLPALYRSIIYEPFLTRLKMYISEIGFDFDISLDDKFNLIVNDLGNVNLLSGGQRVALSLAIRFAIADILGLRLDFILIDEPTIHLDDIRIEEISRVINQISENMQVIVVTHHSKLAEYGNIINI